MVPLPTLLNPVKWILGPSLDPWSRFFLYLFDSSCQCPVLLPSWFSVVNTSVQKSSPSQSPLCTLSLFPILLFFSAHLFILFVQRFFWTRWIFFFSFFGLVKEGFEDFPPLKEVKPFFLPPFPKFAFSLCGPPRVRPFFFFPNAFFFFRIFFGIAVRCLPSFFWLTRHPAGSSPSELLGF